MAGKAPKQRATLHDVAAAAGVSTMTVSNLLRGRLERMSGKTRARIERAIARLGYRPHSTARSLRTSEWRSIGMLIADDAPTFLGGGFMTNLVAGLSNYLSERDYALLLQGVQVKAVRNSLLLRDIRTDGICAFLSGSDASRRASIDALLQLRQPLVVFQETLRFPGQDLCVIRLDDRAGGRMLAQEVIRAGARRLVMLVSRFHWPGIAERTAGVRQAVRAHGQGTALRILRSPTMQFDDVQATLARDLDLHGLPDAVLAGNDHMGIAAMKLLKGRGVSIPGEVLVTGFNAFEFWPYTDPLLTSVRSPAYEMGARGGQALLERLRTGSFASREIVFPVELQRGGSTQGHV